MADDRSTLQQHRGEPDWVRHAVFWHVYPLGATGAFPEVADPDEPPDGHRLRRLLPWLDHAVELGASALLLGPVFDSLTHGYDTTDHFRVDPRLGDDGDLDALLSAAHARGLRVVLDGVFNHVGRAFPQFRRALAEGPESPAARWFHLDWPTDQPGAGQPRAASFEGHDQLVVLDHGSDEVAEHVTRVMTHWLDRGADGWRLDAAYAVPTAFWARVLPPVRAAHPDAYLVGEVIHGDYPRFVRDAGVDAVTQYEFWKAVWSSLNDRNLHELAWALDRHDALVEEFVPLTFVGNHDVTRLASRLSDPRHLPHALVVLLTSAGTPAVYAGDELGLRGVKEDRAGGDDAVRPPLPAQPRQAVQQSPGGTDVLALHQELIGLRRRHPWLHAARTERLHLDGTALVHRVWAGADALVVALNLGDGPVDLPAPGTGGALAGGARVEGAGAGRRVVLPGHGWAVLTG